MMRAEKPGTTRKFLKRRFDIFFLHRRTRHRARKMINPGFPFGLSYSKPSNRSNGFPVQGFSRFFSAVFPVVRVGAGFASDGPPTAENAVFPQYPAR